MRILTFKDGEVKNSGGINKVIVKTNSELAKMGHECTVITTNSLGIPNEEIYEGFRIIRLKSRLGHHLYGLNFGVYLYLKKHFKNLNPDIIHIHGYHGLFSPEIIFIVKNVLKVNIPIVFTCHYDPLNHSTIAGKLLGEFYNKLIGAKILKYTTQIISVSSYEANNISNISKCENIIVIPHGVDLIDIFKAKRKRDFIELLYVGYLLDYKGVQYIIDSLHELIYSRNIQNIRLTIIGEGQYKKKLLARSKKLKVSDYIIWKQFLPPSQVLSEMKQSDIFLLLSKSEGYGIVVAEALAMGTPSIVTKGTALEEFVNEPGCFGINYPPEPTKLADLILDIYSNDVEIGPFSNKIRTWEKVTADYEKLYYRML